ncbi:MAG: hypothetical protein M3063_01465 [Actinomycetota bacterium]|nr:hypothetical protein [Actinomycetota bacterium]
MAGAAFWLYLPLAILVAPALVAVAWALRRRPASVLKLFALAPVGALPWLYTSATDHLQTLQRMQGAQEPAVHRLVHTVTQVLPASLVQSSGLLLSPGVATTVGIVIVAAVVGFVIHQTARRHWLLALAGTPVLLWPFLIAASGVRTSEQTFRYGFLLVPVLALLVAHLADRLRAAVVAPVVAATLTAFGGAQTTANWASAPSFDPNLSAVSSFLVAQHRSHVYADYWVSYVLSVASDERVTASPTGTVRDLHYQALAETAPQATFVFLAGLGLDQQMTAWSKAHNLGHRVALDGYAMWEFSRPVPPGAIPLFGDL